MPSVLVTGTTVMHNLPFSSLVMEVLIRDYLKRDGQAEFTRRLIRLK